MFSTLSLSQTLTLILNSVSPGQKSQKPVIKVLQYSHLPFDFRHYNPITPLSQAFGSILAL